MRKRRDLDHLPEDWSAIEVENMMGRRMLVKNGGLDRERRERYQDILVWNDLGRTLNIYRKTQLDKLRRYQEQKLDRLRGIKEESRAKGSQ